jgi:hypothetical protein
VRRLEPVAQRMMVGGVGFVVIGTCAAAAGVFSGEAHAVEDLVLAATFGTAGMWIATWLGMRRALRKPHPLPDEAVPESRREMLPRELAYAVLMAGYVALFSQVVGAALLGGFVLGAGIGGLSYAAVLRRWETSRRKRVFRERGLRWTPRYYAG